MHSMASFHLQDYFASLVFLETATKRPCIKVEGGFKPFPVSAAQLLEATGAD